MRRFFYFIIFFVAYWMDHIKWGPRDKHKWVFGAYKRFRDNPKYLYYWTIDNHPEIRSIWIARNKEDVRILKQSGYEAYYWLSLKGVFHTITAGVMICDHTIMDVNLFFAGGAFFVNLWHGSGVKRVRWQAKHFFVRNYHLKNEGEMRTSFIFKILCFPDLFKKPDLCLAPSKIQASEFFAPMMDIPLEKCIVGVFPRNQLLIEGTDAALEFIKKYEPQHSMDFIDKLRTYNKVFIYMPTWRYNQNDFFSQARFSWEQLNRILEARNELLILKLHPFTKMNVEMLLEYNNICLYPNASDIYTILPFTDCLITDYSSIYSEFLIMDKEIILFVFDYDDYVNNSYDLAEYDKYYVGTHAYDFDQLLNIIRSGECCKVPVKQRETLMEFYWDNNRNRIDLVEEIKKRIKI